MTVLTSNGSRDDSVDCRGEKESKEDTIARQRQLRPAAVRESAETEKGESEIDQEDVLESDDLLERKE